MVIILMETKYWYYTELEDFTPLHKGLYYGRRVPVSRQLQFNFYYFSF